MQTQLDKVRIDQEVSNAFSLWGRQYRVFKYLCKLFYDHCLHIISTSVCVCNIINARRQLGAV